LALESTTFFLSAFLSPGAGGRAVWTRLFLARRSVLPALACGTADFFLGGLAESEDVVEKARSDDEEVDGDRARRRQRRQMGDAIVVVDDILVQCYAIHDGSVALGDAMQSSAVPGPPPQSNTSITTPLPLLQCNGPK
jgi:hypothetical protein